jgi:EmrB/QacA subfamily drug resistance transporter
VATATKPAGPEAGGGEARYRQIALVVVMMGVMIAAVDTTIVVLALPVMMADLHTDLVTMVWVIMAYLLVMTVLTTQVGRFGDMFGRVRMYNLGFAVFTAGSVACGFATTGAALIAFRVAQAVGGALISSNSGAIIADTFPAAERGRAYGMTSIGYNTGAVLGILLGGLIITFINWRFIFFINLPIGVTALIMGVRVLRERSPRLARRMDLPGVALLGGGLLLFLVGLTDATGAGFTRPVAEMVAAGVVVIAAFVAWERFAQAPLLDLHLLRRRVLTASVFAASLQALGNFAILFLIIMYLQGVRGLSPFAASLLLVPGYVVGGFIGPWSGRIADRVGARTPASIGLLGQVCGVLVYATLGVATPLWVVVTAATINGIGSGFFFPANSSAVMADAPPKDYGVASGLLRTLSNVGMVTSFAVALLIASTAIPRQAAFAIFVGTTRLGAGLASAFVHGLHAALSGSIAFLALALVLSLLRGRESRGAATD